MSAKASPRKKKTSRSTARSTDRTDEVSQQNPADLHAERSDDASAVAEHVLPPTDLPGGVSDLPAVLAGPADTAEHGQVTIEPAISPEPGPAAAAPPLEVSEPAASAPTVSPVEFSADEPKVVPGAEAALIAEPVPVAEAAPVVHGAVLDLAGGEVSSTRALSSIRAALPSREQAAAALRLLTLRQSLLSAIDLLLPTQGVILEIGCGAGLVTAYLAQTAPARTLIGIDPHPTQIQRAERLARDLGLTQNRYVLGDVRSAELPTEVAAIYAIDALRHVPAEAHEEVLTRLAARLQRGGSLVIKELTTASLLGTRVAELVDWTVHKTLTGFLGESARPSRDMPPQYRHHEDWLAMLRRLGLRARAGLVPDLLQPHVLLTATRP